MIVSWHWWRDAVAMRSTRWWRDVRTARAGYNYYAAAVPGTVAPVADAAGKVDYQDSEYYC